MRYDAPDGYDDLIAPRHAPVAAALVEAAALRAGEDVLELAPAQASSRGRRRSRSSRTARTARPTATPRCSFARGQMYGTRLQFVLADYEQPLPFLDGSFDVVLSSLTYVQTASGPVGELARVLRPGRRLALAMWGDSYLEVRMMSAARVSIGQPRFPRAAPGAAVRRLARRGFARVTRRDIELAPRFASVDDYMAYRHAF